ncbi:MAG: hypothetical protein QF412_05175 [Planctomycetota bacterium]|jgi:dienelactone hydrolase|nr:hypothetical protein [Planctomycetota bacterium]
MRLLSVAALLATTLTAQHQVGVRNHTFANPTGEGSSKLLARVFYPANREGENSAPGDHPKGWPVVVFLHGFGTLGNWYVRLGRRLAEDGYIAVMSDTARILPQRQAKDGRSLFFALARENNNRHSVFAGAFDMKRVALAGHSMGGGNTIRILATNPGYRAGFCFAPWDGLLPAGTSDYAKAYAPGVRVPLGIVHGKGDVILPWQRTALRHFDRATGFASFKLLYLLDESCGHRNLVRQRKRAKEVDRNIWERSVTLAMSFFHGVLRDDYSAINATLGAPNPMETSEIETRVAVRSPWPEELAGMVLPELHGVTVRMVRGRVSRLPQSRWSPELPRSASRGR